MVSVDKPLVAQPIKEFIHWNFIKRGNNKKVFGQKTKKNTRCFITPHSTYGIKYIDVLIGKELKYVL